MLSQKDQFAIPEDVSYINCAYMSPLSNKVTRLGEECLRRKQQPFQIQASDFFTETVAVKNAFARLINCADPNRIAIIPSASYGIANVTKNIQLKHKKEIVIVAEQFPSNFYSWERLCQEQHGCIITVNTPDEKDLTESILEVMNEETAVVAIPHVHWADGRKINLQAIRNQCDRLDCLLVIDGTQSVGALPFDVANIRPDALICAGYKWLMGPYSIGVAYYGEALDQGIPIEENWINRLNSQDFKNLVHYQSAYQPLAGRYSVGEQSNFILTPMLRVAIEQLLAWGVQNIQDYCAKIAQPAIDGLQALGCKVASSELRGAHLFGIQLPHHIQLEQLKIELEKERVFVSLRGNSVRVSPHLYNSIEDFANLLDCFKAASK